MNGSFTELLHYWTSKTGDPMWDGLVFMSLGAGLFFTLATGFVQFRLFERSVRKVLGGRKQGDDPYGTTPPQTFVTDLANRVGVGDIANVAIVIGVDGPGTMFWIWLVVLVGMGSTLAESSLTQLFKIRDHDDHRFRGGPAYYITQGLGQRWLNILFVLGLIFCFGFVYGSVQTNSIVVAMEMAWGQDKYAVDVVLIILVAPIIFDGICWMARWPEMVIPVMATLYLLMVLYIVATNIGIVPEVFDMIFSNAFEFDVAGGGLLGDLISQMMVMGIKHDLYSSEAGQDSASNATTTAEVKHSVSQGMIQTLGVFVDAMTICSYAVFIVLMSDLPADSDLNGMWPTQAVIVSHVGGQGADFLAVVLFALAFSTTIGSYAYTESNVKFVKNHWLILSLFRIDVLSMVYLGAASSVPLVQDMVDMTMGAIAWVNLTAILLLSPLVFLLSKDYTAKLKIGKDPQFKLSGHPRLKREIRPDIW